MSRTLRIRGDVSELIDEPEEHSEQVTLRMIDAELRALREDLWDDDKARRRAMTERYKLLELPHDRAFDTFLRLGKSALTHEETRALSVGTDSAGGFTAPARFADRVFTAMKATDKLFDPDVVTVIETKPGTTFSIPMLDDTSASSAIVSENGASATTPDPVFDHLVLAKADTWRSSIVKVPIELLQDNAVDLGQLLTDALAVRLRRGISAAFVTTLASQATNGVTAGASSIVTDNIYDLFASIDPEYVSSPKCGWLMRLSTFVAISKIKDSGGLPVFPITRNANGDFELLTRPVRFCPSVAAIGTGNKSVFFGALDYFVVRTVAGSLRVARHGETFAEVGQVGFLGLVRTNAGLAKPSTADSPIKYLQHS